MMKLQSIILLANALIMMACNQDNDMAILEDKITTWTIGADHNTDTTISIMHSGEGRLSLSDFSVCPNHDTRIEVSLGSTAILDTVMVDTSTTIVFNIPEEALVTIKTSLELNEDLSLCVWLGQATFQYLYFE
ncbi:MAG: hypothetical protein HKN87_17940 [Saprospiraceae bacterium]|nr:hypothetical protein [Saprospiraceae bacterium]